MPILSIFDLTPETVVCFGRFLTYKNRNDSIDFGLVKGPRVPGSEFMKYNKVAISNDHDFADRFHLRYYIEQNEKKIPDREYILDINPFMMYCGFLYLYTWLMWFYTFIF